MKKDIKENLNEIVELYFLGYSLQEILLGVNEDKVSQENTKETNKSKPSKEKKAAIKGKYSDFTLPKLVHPKGYSKDDKLMSEAIRFRKALKELKLIPGDEYEVLAPKHGNRKRERYFLGEFVEETDKLIRLKSKRGYSETFFKSDLLSGYYLIRRLNDD